jgi:hypothetical protein
MGVGLNRFMEPTYLEFQYAAHSGKEFVVFLFEEDQVTYEKLRRYTRGEGRWSTYHRTGDVLTPHDVLTPVPHDLTWQKLTVSRADVLN